MRWWLLCVPLWLIMRLGLYFLIVDRFLVISLIHLSLGRAAQHS